MKFHLLKRFAYVLNHPKPSPKGQKRISKAGRGRNRKERKQSAPKGSFFLVKNGEKPLLEFAGQTLKISVKIPGWRENKG